MPAAPRPCMNTFTERRESMNIRTMRIEDYDAVYDLWIHTPGMGLNETDDSKETRAQALSQRMREGSSASFWLAMTGAGAISTTQQFCRSTAGRALQKSLWKRRCLRWRKKAFRKPLWLCLRGIRPEISSGRQTVLLREKIWSTEIRIYTISKGSIPDT